MRMGRARSEHGRGHKFLGRPYQLSTVCAALTAAFLRTMAGIMSHVKDGSGHGGRCPERQHSAILSLTRGLGLLVENNLGQLEHIPDSCNDLPFYNTSI